ncbi:MAG: hypothetical protein NTU80_05210 [Verrucomicrobia bacterium]|nr:hypothetical protein [Verrucomicrobiota bacterium]
MNAHIGVDAERDLVYTVKISTASVHDSSGLHRTDAPRGNLDRG